MTKHISRLRLTGYFASAVLFSAFLVLPGLDELFSLAPKTTVAESAPDRFPAVRPTLASAVSVFDALRGGYLEKHFGFRGLLIKWHNYLDAYVLASTVSNSPVTAGRDGWLFLAQDGKRNLLEDSLGAPLPEAVMRGVLDDLLARRAWLAERRIPYLAVVAPNKNTVYPEHLPSGYGQSNRDSHLDQLLRYIAEHSDLDVLDLRPTLFREKKNGQIFYVTDSHWNARGGFAAYREIAERLRRFFPDLTPLERGQYAEVVYQGLPGDLSFMLGLQDKLPEERLLFVGAHRARGASSDEPGGEGYFQPPQASEVKDDRLPTAIFFHDSFFWELAPFLAEHFKRAEFLWMRPQSDDAPRFFDKAAIERLKPDIVVDEFTERYFVPSAHPVKPGLQANEGDHS